MANKPKPSSAANGARICSKGHHYNKSSDCPTCPICEAERKPENGLLSTLAAPARRALEKQGILNVRQLSAYTQAEVLSLHGIGPSSLPKLMAALEKEGLSFRG